MKIIKINFKAVIALFTGMILATTSCDVVEQPPVSSFTEATYWQNGTDARSAVAGVYDGFQRLVSGSPTDSWSWASGWMALGDWRAGGMNVQWGGTGCCVPNGGALINQDISPDITYANWNHFYTLINRINLAIKNLPAVVDKDPDYTEAEMKNHLGELHLLRAMNYFKMAQWWKEVPIILEPTIDPSEDLTVEKSSEQDVLAQVKADIDIALQSGYLRSPTDPSLSTAESKGRATTMAAKALLVDYYMWMADYQKAADQAKEIIDSGIYTISGVPYYNNFLDGLQNTNESIFELQYNWGENEASGHVYFSFSEGIIVYGYTNSFINLVKASGDYVSGGRGMMEPWWYHGAWKFIGGSVPGDDVGFFDWPQYTRKDHRNNWTNDNNWIMYRLADIMLMRAEALNRLSGGTSEEAFSLVNQVRTRAKVAPIDFGNVDGASIKGDWKAVEDVIMDERWIELHGEGKRWFDLIRASKDINGNLPTASSADHYLVQQVAEGFNGNRREQLISRVSDPGSWFMPIARREIELNPKLTQNEYWQ
ncbi:MAG: RagB/SusD family nutrient uptake outer membrane protein [Candidatus Cyclobacteriaceae bacterium M3_2C_046]